MVPVMPYVAVPGDNVDEYRVQPHAESDDMTIRPRIMARSGQLRGISPNRAVWCFGFTSGSEAAAAYDIALPHDTLFFWVLATHDGHPVHIVRNRAAIDLPADFRSVIDWDGYALMKARADLYELYVNGDLRGEPLTVAVAYANDGSYHDRCWSWETAQSMALSEGLRVVAVMDDGETTIEQQQALYDAERERYIDCFGINTPELESDEGGDAQ